MQKRWLVAAIICLAVGATLLAASNYTVTKNDSVEQTIGSQINSSTVKFLLPTDQDTVTISVNGSYIIENTTFLKILNQTGSLEYYEQVFTLPVQAHLFNRGSEYVATFEGLTTNGSSTILATVPKEEIQTLHPYDFLQFVAILFVCAGLVLIFASDRKSEKNKKLLKTIGTTELLVLIIFGATYGIGFAFPTYIQISGGIDVLKSLAEVGGVMLGLSGIIFAQLLASLAGLENTIFDHTLRGGSKCSLESCTKNIAERKKALVLATATSISMFLASIIASWVRLSFAETLNPVTDTYSSFGLIALPIFFLVEAVAILIIALALALLDPPKAEFFGLFSD